MSHYRLRYISEICEDIKDHLEALREDPEDSGSAIVFRDVQIHRRTQYTQLASVISNCAEFPAAIIIPGAADIPKMSAVQDARQAQFSVFVVGPAYGEYGEETLDTHDMADLVVLSLQPTSDAPANPKVINYVVYEPTGHTPMEVVEEQDCIECTIQTFDTMRTR